MKPLIVTVAQIGVLFGANEKQISEVAKTFGVEPKEKCLLTSVTDVDVLISAAKPKPNKASKPAKVSGRVATGGTTKRI